jgi:catechol 2,3-dioxygenase-like lactoylglutathione lyase family enzyme
MKRFHVHLGVADLAASIRFYTALFGVPPTVNKEDYAKWMLDDPRVNFAISTHSQTQGLDHLGIQVDSSDELGALQQALAAAEVAVVAQPDTTCCYARSDKHWSQSPEGVAWEAFHSLGSAPTFHGSQQAAEPMSDSACCAPAARTIDIQPASNACRPASGCC